MIEHIEELRLELRLNPLRDREVFEDRHVRQEFSRSGEAVALNVPEITNAGIGKRAALRHDGRAYRRIGIVTKCAHRLEKHYLPRLIVKAAGSQVEATTLAWATRSCIPIKPAILVAGGERQATSNDHGCIPLPSTKEHFSSTRNVA